MIKYTLYYRINIGLKPHSRKRNPIFSLRINKQKDSNIALNNSKT